MEEIRYNGITIFKLSDLFTKEGINRAEGRHSFESVEVINERFATKQVRNINNENLTNKQAVINLAFMLYPRLSVRDLKN